MTETEKIDKLEKEKITLLDKLNLQNQRLNELKKENEELKKQIDQLSTDNHVLKTAFIEQQEQIEKMICCHNCKNFIDKSYCITPCEEHRKWELAE